ARAELPRLRKIIVIETKGMRSFTPEERAVITTFAEVEKLGAESGAQATIDTALATQTLDDIGLMIYTSGSTGKPKGAMLSWRNIRGVVPGIVERLRLSSESSHLSYLPLCHVAEQMLTSLVPPYLGSQVNFGESIRTVQEDLREVAPSVFLGVPRIWEKMYATLLIKRHEAGGLRGWLFDHAVAACAPLADKPRANWSLVERTRFAVYYWLLFRALQNFCGLRRTEVAITGAAPIPPDVVRFFRTIGVPLIEVYGLTESSGMVTGHPVDNVIIGTVGTPTVGVEYRIGDQGELQVRGDMVFVGYYKSPEATAQSIQDGWLHT